jgi:hypothetical protein
MMTKDDMTPYDLACIMALQGVLAANAGRFHDPKEVAADAIHCVNALFAELAKKKEAK